VPVKRELHLPAMVTVRVPDVGFQLLIARLVAEVDPGLVTTVPKPDQQLVTDEVTDPDGETSVQQRPMTPAERQEFAEISNGYLADAGVGEAPPGEDLYLTLPDDVPDMDGLCELLLEDIGERPTDHPSQMAAALREVIPRRYRLGSGSS
jgi:hypothetical protein